MAEQPSSAQEPPAPESGIPQHVAFIMDGNGRWAAERGLPRLAGHRVGVDSIHKVLGFMGDKGVKYVTVYAFSTENWKRPQTEVQGLMDLIQQALDKQAQELHRNNVRVRHLGKTDRLDARLRAGIEQILTLTENNTGVTLSVAFDYGGRDEILEAVKGILADGVPAGQIDEELFSRYLYTSETPDPDLIIRTGGEIRLSNFLLWQSAYSEYYHTPVLWPDLGAEELDKALAAYKERKRRFGEVPTNSQV